ncbi:hypothetical protein FTO74_16210 [Granulicella sp. WH15]|nr:hypothetical protein FTO74_16210 [Granulicella sp. WH15]
MANGAVEIHSGSSFDDFLEKDGYRGEIENAAIKRVLAWQSEQESRIRARTPGVVDRGIREESKSQP